MAQRKQYPLRIDAEGGEAVRWWAEDVVRSVNALVEWILRDALRWAGRLGERRGDLGVHGETEET